MKVKTVKTELSFHYISDHKNTRTHSREQGFDGFEKMESSSSRCGKWSGKPFKITTYGIQRRM